jgi:hypothetical protein
MSGSTLRQGAWPSAPSQGVGVLEGGLLSLSEAPGLHDVLRRAWMMQEGGFFGPKPDPGYTPFKDDALHDFFERHPTSLHLFRDSQSREESQLIRRWQEERVIPRHERMMETGGLTRFAASAFEPMNLVGVMPAGRSLAGAAASLAGLSRLGRAGVVARGAASVNVLQSAADEQIRANTQLGEWHQDPLSNIAFSGVLGLALGALGGSVARGTGTPGRPLEVLDPDTGTWRRMDGSGSEHAASAMALPGFDTDRATLLRAAEAEYARLGEEVALARTHVEDLQERARLAGSTDETANRLWVEAYARYSALATERKEALKALWALRDNEPEGPPEASASQAMPDPLAALRAAVRSGDDDGEALALARWIQGFVARKRAEAPNELSEARWRPGGDTDRGTAEYLRRHFDEIPEEVLERLGRDRWLAHDAETGERHRVRLDDPGSIHGTHIHNLLEEASQARMRAAPEASASQARMPAPEDIPLDGPAWRLPKDQVDPWERVELATNGGRMGFVNVSSDLEMLIPGAAEGITAILRRMVQSRGGETPRYLILTHGELLRILQGKHDLAISQKTYEVLGQHAAHPDWDGMHLIMRNRDNQHIILINEGIDPARMPHILFHEIGHSLETQALHQAPDHIRGAVVAQWRREMNVAENRTIEAASRYIMADMAVELGSLEDPNFARYVASFNEWYAERVSLWLLSAETPRSTVDSFFRDIARRIRVLAGEMLRLFSGKPASETAIERFLEAAWHGRFQRMQRPWTERFDDFIAGSRYGSRDRGVDFAALPPSTPGARAVKPANILGAERLLKWSQLPHLTLINNSLAGRLGDAVAALGPELARIGLKFEGRLEGHAAITDSVEATGDQWLALPHGFKDEITRQYFKYLTGADSNVSGWRSNLTQLKQAAFGAPDGKMTFREFEAAVFAEAPGGPRGAVPEVSAAGAWWRDNFAEAIGKAGAEAGVLVTKEFEALAAAALHRQRAASEARLADWAGDLEAAVGAPTHDPAGSPLAKGMWARELNKLGERHANASKKLRAAILDDDYKRAAGLPTDDQGLADAWADFGKTRDALADHRATATAWTSEAGTAWRDLWERERKHNEFVIERIDLLPDMEPSREAYVHHRPLAHKIEAAWDRYTSMIADYWRDEGAKELTWATTPVRAVIAAAHQTRQGVARTLELAIERHLIGKGEFPPDAKADALAYAAEVRRLMESVEPSRLAVEIRSLLGMRAQIEAPGELGKAIAEALGKARVETEDAPRLVQEIAKGADYGAHDGWSDAQRPGYAKPREIDLPTHLIAEFLDPVLVEPGIDYAKRMGRMIEMSRRYGDPTGLERLHRLEARMLREGVPAAERAKLLEAGRDLRDMVLGSYGTPEDPDAISVRTARVANALASTQMLGMSLFSNITEVGTLIQAHGFRKVMGTAWDLAVENYPAWQRGSEEARKAGAAVELVLQPMARDRGELWDAGGERTRFEKIAGVAAGAMQLLNGVAVWTDIIQRLSATLAMDDMLRLAERMEAGSLSKAEVARAADYGITPEMARRLHGEWQAAGAQEHKGLRLTDTDAWVNRETVRTFRAMLRTAVANSPVQPGASDRPKALYSPLGQTVFLFKSFALAATQRILISGLQQRDARALHGALASIAISWLVVGPDDGPMDPHPIGSWERLFSAVERSGALGILSDINATLETASANGLGLRPLLGVDPPAYAQDPSWARRTAAIAGAASAPWLNVLWAMTSREADGSDLAGAIRRTVPGNNLLYLNGLYGAAAREAGSLIDGD